MAPAWHPGEAHDLWIILWKDIANVSDQIVSGRAKDDGTAPLLTRGTEKPLEILEADAHNEARNKPRVEPWNSWEKPRTP